MISVPNEERVEEPVLYVPEGIIYMFPWEQVPRALAYDGYRRPTRAEPDEYDEKKHVKMNPRALGFSGLSQDEGRAVWAF